MPNIYLRLPTVHCAFIRNRDIEHPLKPEEPLVISQFTDQAVVIRAGLFNGHELQYGKFPNSYSQTEWNNMMQGCPPKGGEKILQRDPQQFLSFREVLQLEGLKNTRLVNSYDFLCIKIPSEVRVGDRVLRTSSSWNLHRSASVRLLELYSVEFRRALCEWRLKTHEYCLQNNITKYSNVEILERFLLYYNITLNEIDRDTLRRQLDRWLDDMQQRPHSYSTFDIDFPDN